MLILLALILVGILAIFAKLRELVTVIRLVLMQLPPIKIKKKEQK